MERNYFFDWLLLLLGLAAVITIFKYPREILFKLPLGIFHREAVKPIKTILLFPLIVAGVVSPGTDDDKTYPSRRNLRVDFNNGRKFIFVISSEKDLRQLIEEFIGVFEGKYSVDDFEISSKNSQTVIVFPNKASFYDFHLTVHHVGHELGDRNSFGIFKSDRLQYFVFKDPLTLNNLVGVTSGKKLFSIYLLDDLETKQHLRLNQKLKIDAAWIEQWSDRLEQIAKV